MRVLMTTDTVSGVWTFTQELASGLLERGYPVLLISFGRLPSAAQREQCQSLSHCFQGRFQYVASEIPLEATEDADQSAFGEGLALLEREAVRFAPDLIHTSQFCYGALDLPMPKVITAHTEFISRDRACQGSHLLRSPWLTRYRSMVQKGLTGADAVVAPTRWTLQELLRSFTPSRSTAIVAHGRSISARFHAPRELRAVCAGRAWDIAKGIDTLADVHSPMPIVVAGETKAGEEGSVQRFGSARLIGQLSEPEMIDLLEHSSVFLSLSWYQPFGINALEAGLCGCAVIARNIPPVREVWGSAAHYFEDAGSLTALLNRLHSEPELLKESREAAFRRAQRFTRSRMVEQYLSLYRRVLAPVTRAQHAA